MPITSVRLKAKESVARGSMAFYLEKPEGFTYKAGQFADFTQIDPPQTDAEGGVRGFTLASAPYEDDLMFATRMRDSAFKRVLEDMTPGTELTFDAPYGSFILHNNQSAPAVLLTGGVGVTPARSIILQAAHDKRPHRITLFLANRTPEVAMFLDELKAVEQTNPNYTFVATMTQMDRSDQPWDGERGHIDAAMLHRHVEDIAAPIYYLCGPRGMVGGLKKVLGEAGVDDDNIRTEEFSGY